MSRRQFEKETGLHFDPDGPPLIECEYCGQPLQYVTDHHCHGLKQASKAAQRESAYNLDYFSGRD